MLKIPEFLAETTVAAPSYDVLSDVLRSLRIGGSTLLNDEYALPWAIAIPNTDRLGVLLQVPKNVRVVAFHFVKRGYIEIAIKDDNRAIVEAGEIAICFGGVAHQISQGDNPLVLDVETLLTGGENVFKSRCSDRSQIRSAALTCGVFLLHDIELNPLISALPPLLQLSTNRANGFPNLTAIADLIVQEVDRTQVGSEYVVERLLELLCAEAVRSHVNSTSMESSGWIVGLKDPAIGKAIALIHAQPGNSWTIEKIANAVSLSPSRFAARFGSAIGESPMAYIAKWRMNLAGRLLRRTTQGVQQIATEVGYESLPAFNRAFKKHLGLPPAAWRSQK